MMKAIKNPAFEELLVADPHFDWLALRALLFEPLRD